MMKYLNMLYPWVATVALIVWTISIIQYARIFNQLYKTIDSMQHQLTMIASAFITKENDPRSWVMPTHCFSCGVVLQGGATQHKEGCEIRQMIERNFPKVH